MERRTVYTVNFVLLGLCFITFFPWTVVSISCPSTNFAVDSFPFTAYVPVNLTLVNGVGGKTVLTVWSPRTPITTNYNPPGFVHYFLPLPNRASPGSYIANDVIVPHGSDPFTTNYPVTMTNVASCGGNLHNPNPNLADGNANPKVLFFKAIVLSLNASSGTIVLPEYWNTYVGSGADLATQSTVTPLFAENCSPNPSISDYCDFQVQSYTSGAGCNCPLAHSTSSRGYTNIDLTGTGLGFSATDNFQVTGQNTQNSGLPTDASVSSFSLQLDGCCSNLNLKRGYIKVLQTATIAPCQGVRTSTGQCIPVPIYPNTQYLDTTYTSGASFEQTRVRCSPGYAGPIYTGTYSNNAWVFSPSVPNCTKCNKYTQYSRMQSTYSECVTCTSCGGREYTYDGCTLDQDALCTTCTPSAIYTVRSPSDELQTFDPDESSAYAYTLECTEGRGFKAGAALALAIMNISTSEPIVEPVQSATSTCDRIGTYRSTRGWSNDFIPNLPPSLTTASVCYDCWSNVSIWGKAKYTVTPPIDRTNRDFLFQCAPSFYPSVTVELYNVTVGINGSITCPSTYEFADRMNIQMQKNTLCDQLGINEIATTNYFSVQKILSNDGINVTCKLNTTPARFIRTISFSSILSSSLVMGSKSLVLCQPSVLYPKLDNPNYVPLFDDILLDESTSHSVIEQKCYAAGGDDYNLLNSISNGRKPIDCQCAGIPGAHMCSTDTSTQAWSADGSASYTRLSYSAGDEWLFDPTDPESRGSILVAIEPYVRKIDGTRLTFYLDEALSNWPTGKMVFISDSVGGADTITLEMLVRAKPRGVATTGDMIPLEDTGEMWYNSAQELEAMNSNYVRAVAITQYTKDFYFDLRFYKSSNKTIGGYSLLYSKAVRTVGQALQSGDYEPVFGVRFDWLYRHCEAGTFQSGNECIPCPSGTCTPLRNQVARLDGTSPCLPCQCGKSTITPEDPDPCYECSGTCACGVRPGKCNIAGMCYDTYYSITPENVCLQCRPDVSTSVWTPVNDPSFLCDDGDLCTMNDSCQEGICHGTNLQCLSYNQTGDRTQACEMCGGNAGCVQDIAFPGCIYYYDYENNPSNRTCGCSIDSECYPQGAVNPDNSCLVCDVQVTATAWSPRPPVDCDDGNSCTFGDFCSTGGVCEGIPYSCSTSDAPCLESSTCNGAGQCDVTYKSSETLCAVGDGYCQPDRYCSGKNGFCPPRLTLNPYVYRGDVSIGTDLSYDTLFSQTMEQESDDSSPSYVSTSFVSLPISLTNWTVDCGYIDFSLGWYSDPLSTSNCDIHTVSTFTDWERATGLPVNVSSPSYDQDANSTGYFSTDASLPLQSLNGAAWVNLFIKARNIHGKESAYCFSPVIVDNSPPVPSGLVRNIDPTANVGERNGNVFAHDGTYLAFTWEPFTESLPSSWNGLLSYYWAIGTTQGGTDIVTWQFAGIGTGSATTMDMESVLVPYYGVPLFVTVRGYNRVGLYTDVYSESSVIIDPSSAIDCQVVDGNAATFTNIPIQTSYSSFIDESLTMQLFNCRDPESGLKGYRVCWGTEIGECDVTSLYSYSFGGSINAPYVYRMKDTELQHTDSMLDLVPGITYYANVWIVSGSGATRFVSSSGYTIDITPPSNVQLLVPSYSNTDSSLNVAWKYVENETPVVSARVWVGSTRRENMVDNNLAVLPDTIPITVIQGSVLSNTGPTVLTVPMKNNAVNVLIQGKTYYICSNVTNGAGLVSPTVCVTTTIDVTPPTTGKIVAVSPTDINGLAIAGTNQVNLGIAARWDAATDDLSGIQSYLVRLTTNGVHRNTTGDLIPSSGPGTIPVTPWTKINGLFITLRPSSTLTNDDNTGITYTDLVPGWTYWITVRITNGAGSTIEITTDGVFAGKNSLPDTGTVIVPNSLKYNPFQHSTWWNMGDSLTFSFASLVDTDVGIQEYKYAIGTCTVPTLESIVPWTSLGNNQGRTVATVPVILSTNQNYCVSVRAVSNAAQAVTATSTAFRYDDSLPLTNVQNGIYILDVPLTVTGNDGRLNATLSIANPTVEIDYSRTYSINNKIAYVGVVWSSMIDNESGLQGYWVCYGTSSRGSCDSNTDYFVPSNITQWTHAIPNIEIGTRIYITVCALNNAGGCTYLMSDGVLMDPLPPRAGHFVFYGGISVSPNILNETSIPVSDDNIALPFYINNHPRVVPIDMGIVGFQTSGSPIANVFLSVGSTIGGSSIMDQQDFGTSTRLILSPTLPQLQNVQHGDKFCPTVTVFAANGLSVRYVSPRCIVYDGTPAQAFTAYLTVQSVDFLVQNPAKAEHMRSWPYRNYLRICLSNFGDEHSGLARTTVSIGNSPFDLDYSPLAPIPITQLSNLLPQKYSAFSCYEINNNQQLQLQQDVSHTLTIVQTNGAGIPTVFVTPSFIIDNVAPLDFEVALAYPSIVDNSPSFTVPGSVYVPPPTGPLVVYFTPAVDITSQATVIDYWASIGSSPGLTDRIPWCKVINIQPNVVLNGPAGDFLRVNRGTFSTVGLSSPTVTSTLPPGVSYVNILALDETGKALLLSGSGQVEVTDTMLNGGNTKSAIGGTIATSSVALLIDPSVPTFLAAPVILSSSLQDGTTNMLMNGFRFDRNAVRLHHASAVNNPLEVTVAWEPAFLSTGADIANYQSCIYLATKDGNNNFIPGTLLQCRFAGLRNTITFTFTAPFLSGTTFIGKVEAFSVTGIMGTAYTPPSTLDTEPPMIRGNIMLIQDFSKGFQQAKYISARVRSSSMFSSGGVTSIESVADVAIAWQNTRDNDGGTGIGLYEAAIGTEVGGTQLMFFRPLENVEQITLNGLPIFRAPLPGVRMPHGSPVYVTLRVTDAAGNKAVSASGVMMTAISLAPNPKGLGIAVVNNFQTNRQLVDVIIQHPGGMKVEDILAVSPDDISHPVLPGGLETYMMCLSYIPNDPECRSPVTPGGNWREIGISSQETFGGLQLVDGQSYYPVVRAVSYTGMSTVTVTNAVGIVTRVTVDRSPPNGGTVSIPTMISSQEFIPVTWNRFRDAVSGIQKISAIIKVFNTSTFLNDWITVDGSSKSLQLRFPNVTYDAHAMRIVVSLRACDRVDLCTVVDSNVAKVDLTPPVPGAGITILSAPYTPTNFVKANYIISSSVVHAAWYSWTDTDSGMQLYSIAIGTSSEGQQILPFTTFSLDMVKCTPICRYSFTNLTLEGGLQIYVTVKGINNVGFSSTLVSEPVMVSFMRPIPFNVYDGSVLEVAVTKPESSLVRGVAIIPESICKYTLNNVCYYVENKKVAVNASDSRCRNAAPSNISTVCKNVESLLNRYSSMDTDIIPISRTLGCHWSLSGDPFTGILYYQVSFGTAPGLRNVVPVRNVSSTTNSFVLPYNVSNPLLYPPGPVYCTVVAIGGNGLVRSVSSNGAIFDRTAPMNIGKPQVIRLANSPSFEYQNDPTQLSVSWTNTFVDRETDIIAYEISAVQIGATAHQNATNKIEFVPDATNGWIRVSGGVSTAILRNLHLQSGERYAVVVRAQNGAGLWSDVTVSAASMVMDFDGPLPSNDAVGIAVSINRLQSGRKSRGLTPYGYLSDPNIVSTLLDEVRGIDENYTFSVNITIWKPILTANIPPSPSTRLFSYDGVTCPFSNRPNEVPITVRHTNGSGLNEEWFTRSVQNKETNLYHGSLCAAGTYRSIFGICAPCPPGTYKSWVGDDSSCTQCGELTWFATRYSQVSYGSIPRSYSSAERLQGNLTETYSRCACLDHVTQIFDTATSSCLCKPGHYLNKFDRLPDVSNDPNPPDYPNGIISSVDEVCSRCPDGMFKINVGNNQSDCLKCPTGSSSNDDRTFCMCSDLTKQWDPVSNVCLCKPGTYYDTVRKECTVCPGRLHYKDLPGNDRNQCKRCPFGTEPNRDKTLCTSTLSGMVYEHKVGAGTENKGYCPPGTYHAYLGTQQVVKPGILFGFMDPVTFTPDWILTEKSGSTCFESTEEVDTGDEYFGNPAWYDNEAQDGTLYTTDDIQYFKVGYYDNITKDYTTPLVKTPNTTIPYPALSRYGQAWMNNNQPQHRSTPVYDFLVNYYYNPKRYLAVVAEQVVYELAANVSADIELATLLLRYFPNNAVIQNYSTLILNRYHPLLARTEAFFPNGNGKLSETERTALYRKGVPDIATKTEEDIMTAIEQLKTDALDYAYMLSNRSLALWWQQGAMAYYKHSTFSPNSKGFRVQTIDTTSLNNEEIIQWLTTLGNLSTVTTQMDEDLWTTSYRNTLLNLVSIVEYLSGKTYWTSKTFIDTTDIETLVRQRLGFFWEYADYRTYYPFDGEMPYPSQWYTHGLQLNSSDQPAYNTKATVNAIRQQQGLGMIYNPTWQKWANLMDTYIQLAKDGSALRLPKQNPINGVKFPSQIGSGIYMLSRTKCSFIREVPVHACVLCPSGTIQPQSIPLEWELREGKLYDKRENEGTCSKCPTMGEFMEKVKPVEGMDMGSFNYFVLANLTYLYADWTGIFEQDKVSGIAEYRVALGSSPGGSHYYPFTKVNPSTSTVMEWKIDETMIQRMNLQPGAPIFLSVLAFDKAGNSGLYTDQNPVIWDANGPISGDAKDALLDDYIPPTFATSSLNTGDSTILSAAAASLAGRRLHDSPLHSPTLSTSLSSSNTFIAESTTVSRSNGPVVGERNKIRSYGLSLSPDSSEYVEVSNNRKRVSSSSSSSSRTNDRSSTSATVRSARGLTLDTLQAKIIHTVPFKTTSSDKVTTAYGRRLQFGEIPVTSNSSAYDWHLDPTLTDITYVSDLDFQTDTTSLVVTYEAFGSLASGIAGLTYCAGTRPYSCDIAPVTLVDNLDGNIPTANSIQITDLNMAVPSFAYVTITAVSGSGLISSIVTDGVRIDNRPPSNEQAWIVDTGRDALLPSYILGAGHVANVSASSASDIDCDAAFEGVGAVWGGYDVPLGLDHYEWCIHSVLFPIRSYSTASLLTCDILPWTDVGLATAVFNASVLLPTGAVIFTSVRAVDRIGQTSMITTDGVRIMDPLPVTEDTTVPIINATNNQLLNSTEFYAAQNNENLYVKEITKMENTTNVGTTVTLRSRVLCFGNPSDYLSLQSLESIQAKKDSVDLTVEENEFINNYLPEDAVRIYSDIALLEE